ncbi:YeiH family protein [Halanaerobium salsuginis]|jgi:uncharacterized integral membrane protein (TIGR00698 family)|uniref:Conserved hypothetical integral membrane protein n=1 Tax=Halanaerobium salsuginis TaxID=29563 RepID=A0A1I4JA78_9FIRM|nr:putative sulfate exporter family transporter [Halanaerobium salsuginis]SFL63450.1 conserved hypothetical integral membrane protein [Halanaerobium salsuginis]
MSYLISYLKENIKGLTLTILIAILANYLAKLIPNLGAVTSAIILGFILGNLIDLNDSYGPGVKFAEKKLLAAAIMLMGVKLQLNVLKELGFTSIMLIIFVVALTVFSGFIIGKLLGLNNKFGLLIGIGNAICGSSAIAASAPVIGNTEEEIGLSVSVVNLLGTIGIFTLPFLARLIGLNNTNSGLLIGTTLQATGQVVAAGFSVNDLVGRIATIVKMGRILMLGPVVVLLSLLFNDKSKSKQAKVKIPTFIIGFLILGILASLNLIPNLLIDYLKIISHLLLITAMAAIGLKIKISALLKQGPKTLLVGLGTAWIQVAGAALLVILFFK